MDAPDLAPELSVVAPVFNEAECLDEFVRRTLTVLTQLAVPSELILVDDGSTDDTPHRLARLTAPTERPRTGGPPTTERAGTGTHTPTLVVVTLSRNFGHQAAVTAGMDAARGRAVVVIDTDLQDPPELITELVAAWRDGSQVVHAVRRTRSGESRFKLWTAGGFYALIRRWTDLDITADAGDFRLYDRVAVDAMASMPERGRFIRGMAAWVGFTQTSVTYDRDPRLAGNTKYPLRKMVSLASTALTSFSVVPLQLASLLGFGLAALAGILTPVVLAARLAGASGLGGQTTVLLAVLFFGGVQLVFIGVLGEYLGRIMVEIKQRPVYLTRSIVRSDCPRTTATDPD